MSLKAEYELIIAKKEAGKKLGTKEIGVLMLYALELLRDFGTETQASIDRAKARNSGESDGR